MMLGLPKSAYIAGGATLLTMLHRPTRTRLHKSPGSNIVPRSRRLSTSALRPARSLTHLDHTGRPTMVDVSQKEVTQRTATATGRIFIPPVAYDLIISTHATTDDHNSDQLDVTKAKARRKGDALTVAQLAAIMGSKKTSELIPLCHPLALSNVSVTLTPEVYTRPTPDASNPSVARYSILCRAAVSSEGKTGVEMEALTAVSVGLLTVWDMLKAVAGREMEIGEIFVVNKTGGKSGDFTRE